MKKILLLTVSILMVSVTFGQYSIPSYNVPVTGTVVFVSPNTINANGTSPSLIAEKRDVSVTNEGGGNGPTGGSLVFYVICTTQPIVLGPYTVGPGQTVSVPIDANQWNVSMYTSQTTLVNVWIDNGGNM
ncbi:MAG: hypothetical protein ABSD71_09945 [Bacteroidales bacterium]|jgi:hypothetical protein